MVNNRTQQDLLASTLIILLSLSSALVMYGWGTQQYWATTFLLGGATMKFNTALCFMLLAGGLLAIQLRQPIVSSLLGGAVAALSATTLLEYVSGWNMHLDQLFAADNWNSQYPGRMGAGAATWMLLASGLIITQHSFPHRHISLYDNLLTAFLTVPLFGVFSYIFAPEEVLETPVLKEMGFHTCINFLLVFFSILFLTHSKGGAGLMTRQTRHGRNFRILFFLVLILPMSLGSILRYASQQHWIGSGIGIAIFCLFSTLIITCTLANHSIVMDHWFKQLRGEKRKTNLLQQQIHELIEIAPDGILLFDGDLQILHANSGAKRILGYSPQEFKTMHLEQLLPEHKRNNSYIEMDQYIRDKQGPRSFTVPNRVFLLHKDGKELPVSVSLTKKYHLDQTLLIAIIKNMSKIDGQLKTLEKKVFTDALTQTLNRAAFQSFSERISIHELRKSDINFCLMVIDIDDFKVINDTYGHDAGDQVLMGFAKIIKKILRNGDRLFRTGGEEFILVTANLSESDAGIFAERLRHAVEIYALCYDHTTINITCSIGVCVLESPKQDLQLAVRRADSAMYQAKNNGKNRVVIAPPVQPKTPLSQTQS